MTTSVGVKAGGAARDTRVPVLYLAPWVGYGGSDTGTIDWFKWIDRERFRPSLITTQPSTNDRITEVLPYADEVWPLPELMWGNDFPDMILDFIYSRGIRLVHIMNSRIAYNLLPDIKRLPDPPATVVQLHVEEADRSGYVRYVTTRFGTLVDAFSVTSRQLAEVVVGYGVPEAKCRVIYTGVDAEAIFSPELVQPAQLAESAALEVLFPARLVEQKDPLLMVEVAAALAEGGVDFRIHVVGEGALEEDVRRAVQARFLDTQVVLHGPSRDMPPWYRACDVLLMTSTFEGVPYAVYEAMAMGLPVVAPALPGNVELLPENEPALIQDRGDARAYAEALRTLALDPEKRRAIGGRLRRRAIEQFSLSKMGSDHAALYDELLASREPPEAPMIRPLGASEPDNGNARLLFRNRRPGRPLVSIVTPCFNHGPYLLECLESISRQTYRQLDVIVVDDGSTDPETLQILNEVGKRQDLTLIRLGHNRGPSGARNAGIARARGRYVLPVDADNLLLPDAIQRLVEHIEGAGEEVGFIYPNQVFFGNRTDFHRVPRYNMHTLLRTNYCDTCSLIDRDIFDAGVYYDETVGLGHEDWDFALQLAARGVVGEPARTPTLLTRKAGFTRSDLVDVDLASFADRMRVRHPDLYGAELGIKARWSPGVSIVGLEPVNPADDRALEEVLAAQSMRDAELVIRHPYGRMRAGEGPILRRIHADLAHNRAEAANQGVEVARGRVVVLTNGTGAELLQDPALLEKLMRVMQTPGVAVALADEAGALMLPLTHLPTERVLEFRPFAIAWSRVATKTIPAVAISASDPVADIADVLMRHTLVEWRHLPSAPGVQPGRAVADGAELRVSTITLSGRSAHGADEQERTARLASEPLLPGRPGPPRIDGWLPPQSRWLFRHVNPETGERSVSLDYNPPAGFVREYTLGSISRFPLQGTVPLSGGGQGRRPALAAADAPQEDFLGCVETAPLPLLDAVFVARTPAGWTTLVAGEEDPLVGRAEVVEAIGWIEPAPLRPRRFNPEPVERVLAVLASRTDELEAAERALLACREESDHLKRRLDRIVASFPARVYRKIKGKPGFERLLVRMRGR